MRKIPPAAMEIPEPFKKIIAELEEENRSLRSDALNFQQLFSHAPQAIQLFTPQGDLVKVNKAWERLWGVEAGQGVGRYNVFQDTYLREAGVLALFEKAAAGESVYIPDYHYDPQKNGLPGRARWLRTAIYPVLTTDGSVGHVVVLHEDISELKALEEKYRIMVDEASETVLVLKDACIIFANPMTFKLTHYKREEVVGKPFLPFIHPDDRRRLVSIYTRRMQGQSAPDSYEFRVLDKDGMVLWLQGHATLISWEGDAAVLLMLSDVTARKKAERQLQTYQEDLEGLVQKRTDYLETLLAVSRGMGRSVDLHELYRQCTRVAAEILDLDFSTLMLLEKDKLVIRDTVGFPEEMIDTFALLKGQGLSTYVVEQKRGAVVRDFLKEERFDVPQVVSRLGLRSSIAVPMMEGDTVFGVLIGHCTRVREFSPEEVGLYQGLANQAAVAIKNALHVASLKKSEQTFRMLFHGASEAMFLVDASGVILDANHQAYQLTGRSPGGLEGLHVLELHPEQEREEAKGQFAMLVQQGRIERVRGYHFTKPDGTCVPVEISAAMADVHGSRHVIGTIRDLTEQLQRQEDHLRLEKMESLGLLAGGIAHDFNNLLTAILGNISLLQLRLQDREDCRDQLGEVEQATRRAQQLTRQMLTFARGGAPVKQQTDVAELVRDSSVFVLRGTNVVCDIAIPDGLWGLEVDSGQISQVVQNMVINAAHAMPDGGTIRIRLENVMAESDAGDLAPGPYLCIRFEDSGIGIPEKYLVKIFDPYFSTKEKGSGLGLATSYSIVKRHGGHITVTSTPGKGTVFCVYLPAQPESAAADDIAEDTPGLQRGAGKILVMDDEEFVRKIAGALLTELGYEPFFAVDGAEAVEMYGAAMDSGRRFDAVLLDLTIPGGMGGREAMQKLRRLDPDIRAIVSSGYTDDALMAEADEHGFVGVLAKPYVIEEMARVLKECVG